MKGPQEPCCLVEVRDSTPKHARTTGARLFVSESLLTPTTSLFIESHIRVLYSCNPLLKKNNISFLSIENLLQREKICYFKSVF